MNKKILLIRLGLLLILLFSLNGFAGVSSAKPDLKINVIDKQQGLIEVKNIGALSSPPSVLYVNCTRLWQGDSQRCAAGLKLSNYITRWNILSYEIPVLQKNQGFKIKLFSEDNFPRKTGFYGISLTIDPLKKITESNELNNQSRLDVNLKNTIIETDGILSITFKDNSHTNNIKRRYAVSAYGHRGYITQGEIYLLKPIVLILKPGKYSLHIIENWKQMNRQHNSDFSINPIIGPEMKQTYTNIVIKPGEKTSKNVTFDPVKTGKLQLSAFLDGKLTKAQIQIFRSSDRAFAFSSFPDSISTPVDLNLIPGSYEVYINPKGSLSGSEFIGYPEKVFKPQSFSLKIKANKKINHIVRFKHVKKSQLVLKVLLNGVMVKAKIQVKPPGKDKKYYRNLTSNYQYFSNIVELLPGQYDLLITPYTLHFAPPAISTYHQAGFSVGGFKYYPNAKKAVKLPDISIESGENITRTLEINDS